MADELEDIYDELKLINTSLNDFAHIMVRLVDNIRQMLETNFENIETILSDGFAGVTEAVAEAADQANNGGGGFLGRLKEFVQDLNLGPATGWIVAIIDVIQDVQDGFKAIFDYIKNAVAFVFKQAERLIKLVANQIEKQRKYAELNGQLATAFALHDVRQLFRDIEFANGTASSTEDLLNAVDDLLDAVNPTLIGITNIVNSILAYIAEGVTAIRENIIGPIGEFLSQFREVIRKIGFLNETIGKAYDLAKKAWEGDQNKELKPFAVEQFMNDVIKGNIDRHRLPMFGGAGI